MKLKFRNNFLGYFQFYYSVVGYRFLLNLLLCVLVSFLDGIGLAMFIPLLQAVGGEAESAKESLGKLSYITDTIQELGFPLTINTVLVVMIILFSSKGLFRFLQLNYQKHLRYIFIKKVRYSFVDHLQNLSYKGFVKLDAGRLQNTLIAETQRVFQTMTQYFLAAQGGVMLLTYIVLAFLANYQFAFFVTLGAGLTSIIFRKIFKATKRASIAVSKKGHKLNSFMLQAVHYFKYLKATNYFGGFSAKLKKVIEERELLNRKMGYYQAVIQSVREPVIICIVALVIFIQISWMGGSIGPIIIILLLFFRALTYLMTVQNSWQMFIQNVGSMDSIASLSEEMIELKEKQAVETFPSLQQELNINSVSFAYGSHKVLDVINMHIPKNKTVALVGESGSGKTTLANLIAGLIQPDEGAVLVDNISLQHYNLNSYRNKVGYISQEPVIFNDDIFNNITFWAEPNAENLQRFWKAVELASLDKYVDVLPAKERTKLGDHGLLISGGQKQRISIARELYKNVEILILDEATSALDSETERVIQLNIEKLHGSYTMIIIAHRLSTIRNADLIYLLDKGSVVASGNFSEMLYRSARFKQMVSLQEF